MKIEDDRAEILAGVRFGRTLGSPVSMLIRNLDHENWRLAMSTAGPHPGPEAARAVTRPRPGHADLAGALKYGTHDARDVFERSSARETAARTAAGTLARLLLEEAGIQVLLAYESASLLFGITVDGLPLSEVRILVPTERAEEAHQILAAPPPPGWETEATESSDEDDPDS